MLTASYDLKLALSFTLLVGLKSVTSDNNNSPDFVEPITNVTVPVGREAILICVVKNLQSYKVAWLRVDTQTILSIAGHVITKNHRVGVTRGERRWRLHVRDVRVTDAGRYMCQVNTEPMISQTGWIHVVVPPDIIDGQSSGLVTSVEGEAAALHCAASGAPPPALLWRREDARQMRTNHDTEVPSVGGEWLNFSRVERHDAGAFLCIASNGVPPSVSKRVLLDVHHPPQVWVIDQLVGAELDATATIECKTQSSPPPTTSWTRYNNEIITQSERHHYTTEMVGDEYHMKLRISNVTLLDYGVFRCVAHNALGQADGSIKLYMIIMTTVPPSPATATSIATWSTLLVTQGLSMKRLKSPFNQASKNETHPLEVQNKFKNVSIVSKHEMRDKVNTETMRPDAGRRRVTPTVAIAGMPAFTRLLTTAAFLLHLFFYRIIYS